MRERWPLMVALQLGAVWAVGAVVPPAAAGFVAVLAWAAGPAAAGVAAIVAALVMLPALGAIIWGTGSVSALGATWPRRVLWVALVLVFGTLVLGAGWALAHEAQLHWAINPAASGLAFMLVAGLLLRRWQLPTAAAAALLCLAAGGLVALRNSGPDELTLRLQQAALDRKLAYVVEIPGYRTESSGSFWPEDPDLVPAERHIAIIAYSSVLPGTGGPCGETALDSRLSIADCTPEPDGLVYRRGVMEHGYQVKFGEVPVVVSGTLSVERELLRGAAKTVRPATPAELAAMHHERPLYVADIPGYSAQPMGIPPGTQYQPTDPRLKPHSVHIRMHAAHAHEPSVCFQTYQCTPEGDGLVYRRQLDEQHGYVSRRGDVDVYVTGGLSVDRELLRTAARQARPATDDELLRTLPEPPPPREPLERLRNWLRRISVVHSGWPICDRSFDAIATITGC